MAKSSREMKAAAELKRLENERDFFDDFERIEQKCRLKDEYPSANDLIGIDAYTSMLTSVYGSTNKAISDSNGKLAGFTVKDDDNVKLIKELADIIKKRKMEYSISIEGIGRTEFIKTRIQPKQDEEDEKDKDVIDKIADAIG